MQIDKQQVVELLKGRGQHENAEKARTDLPDRVDTDEHAGRLQELGVDPSDLTGGSDGGLRAKLGL